MPIDDDRKFAVLIPTLNGTPFLRRTLDYLRQQEYQGHVVIADSSTGPPREFVDACQTQYPELFLDVYRHDASMRFVDKLCATLESMAAEFVLLHANDDFMLPDAVEECVRLLDGNPDYSAARGRVAMINLSRLPDQEGRNAVGLSFVPSPAREYVQDDPLERMLAHIERYSSTFYSVHRRSCLLESLAITERDTRHVVFFQYLSSTIAALQGKIACIERLFYVRQGHAQSMAAALKAERDPELWPWLITSPDFSRHYHEFRGSLCRLVRERLGRDEAEVGPLIDDAAIGLFQRGFCTREVDNPAEAGFFGRLNDSASTEHAQVKKIVDFTLGHPDTY